MTTTGGDRIGGDEFRKRREKLGLARNALATFALVSLKTVETYEAGTTNPRPSEYERMVDVLEQLEDGQPVVAALHQTRSGRVIVSPGPLRDPDAADRFLDEIVKKSHTERDK